MTGLDQQECEVLAMHSDEIERYGGSEGVRALGLLEAALFRPQTRYYADAIEEAAALWESCLKTIRYRRQQAYGFCCNVYFSRDQRCAPHSRRPEDAEFCALTQ